MDLFEKHSESDRVIALGPTVKRRGFIKGLFGGLAIAMPAFEVLTSASSASAASNPCAKFYVTLYATWCSTTPSVEGCPAGPAGVCYQEYAKWSSTVPGYWCGSFTDTAGECGVAACGAAPASAAQAC